MIRHLLLGIFLVTCFNFSPARAQDLQTSIVGVWKLSSITRKDPQSGQVTHSFGERPVGYLVSTKAGRIFSFLVGSNKKSPDKPEPTVSERARFLYTDAGNTETYRVEGG